MDSDRLMKDFCCFFYDRAIMPRFVDEWENRKECAEALKDFLNRMNITFDEFYRYVLDYSLGNGLEYMKEVNEMMDLV